MRIVKIKTNKLGGHQNQTYHGVVPKGWALIPEDMETINFPFGEVVTEEIEGVMIVTSWIPGVVPIVPEAPIVEDESAEAVIDVLLGVGE